MKPGDWSSDPLTIGSTFPTSLSTAEDPHDQRSTRLARLSDRGFRVGWVPPWSSPDSSQTTEKLPRPSARAEITRLRKATRPYLVFCILSILVAVRHMPHTYTSFSFLVRGNESTPSQLANGFIRPLDNPAA